MNKWLIGFTVFGLTCINTAHAVGISAEAGTTGIGGHLVIPITDNKLNARLGANMFSYDYDGHTSDVNYRFKLKLQTYDALLDYYPFGGAFRLTLGGVLNKTSMRTNATTNKITINGRDYQTEDVGRLQGRIDFKKYVPYVGLGWGNAAATSKGWGLTSDIGLILQGAPQSELHSDGCKVSASSCAQFQQDLNQENEKLKDTTKNFKYYPVIRVGVTYRF